METTGNETSHRIASAGSGAIHPVTERDSTALSEELLSVLLHDLRSPLGAIGVLADVISSATDEHPPEPRQLLLLQEAVAKAQRVLDDAVEIQSVIRGSSTLTPAHIEMRAILKNSLEKANHAPYFRNVQIDYDSRHEDEVVQVDVEKAETAILCALEQTVSEADRPSHIRIYHSVQHPFVNLHLVNERPPAHHDAPIFRKSSANSLRGRLGTRKLGESRYNLKICSQVMNQMGGRIEHSIGDFGRLMILRFPTSAK